MNDSNYSPEARDFFVQFGQQWKKSEGYKTAEIEEARRWYDCKRRREAGEDFDQPLPQKARARNRWNIALALGLPAAAAVVGSIAWWMIADKKPIDSSGPTSLPKISRTDDGSDHASNSLPTIAVPRTQSPDQNQKAGISTLSFYHDYLLREFNITPNQAEKEKDFFEKDPSYDPDYATPYQYSLGLTPEHAEHDTLVRLYQLQTGKTPFGFTADEGDSKAFGVWVRERKQLQKAADEDADLLLLMKFLQFDFEPKKSLNQVTLTVIFAQPLLHDRLQDDHAFWAFLLKRIEQFARAKKLNPKPVITVLRQNDPVESHILSVIF